MAKELQTVKLEISVVVFNNIVQGLEHQMQFLNVDSRNSANALIAIHKEIGVDYQIAQSYWDQFKPKPPQVPENVEVQDVIKPWWKIF